MNRKLIIEDDSVYEIDEACVKKKEWEKRKTAPDCTGEWEHEYRKSPDKNDANRRWSKK